MMECPASMFHRLLKFCTSEDCTNRVAGGVSHIRGKSVYRLSVLFAEFPCSPAEPQGQISHSPMVAATRCPQLHGFDRCCPSGAAAAGFLTAHSNMRTVQVATVQRDKIIGNLRQTFRSYLGLCDA